MKRWFPTSFMPLPCDHSNWCLRIAATMIIIFLIEVDLLSVDICHGGQRVSCLVPLPGLLVLGRRSLEDFGLI